MLQISTLRNLMAKAVSLILPPTCPLCTAPLHPTEPFGLCPTCWTKLPRWKKEAIPSPRLPLHLNSFNAPFLYEEDVRNLILQFKFTDKTELAPVLAPFLIPYLPKQENTLLVPIPLHPKRLRQRLYNQSALLVQEIAKITKTPSNITTALTKTIHTAPQAKRSAAARKKLAQNTFKANPDVVAGKNIILIDDIYTTGSTLNAAAGMLKKAGAESVHALTLAYTQP